MFMIRSGIYRGRFRRSRCCQKIGTDKTCNIISQHTLLVDKVASRRVIQSGAILMLILGLITKFCAVFVTIPDPIVGGVYIVMFGIVTAVGLSNLQFVDLNSSRNLFIVGLSLLLGLSVPTWMGNNKTMISTGEPIVDEIFVVLLSTGMFVGGAVAFFLDNTIPGTRKERGLTAWSNDSNSNLTNEELRKKYTCYDMPFGNDAIYRAKWTSFIPICPNFLFHRRSKPEKSEGTACGSSVEDERV